MRELRFLPPVWPERHFCPRGGDEVLALAGPLAGGPHGKEQGKLMARPKALLWTAFPSSPRLQGRLLTCHWLSCGLEAPREPQLMGLSKGSLAP